MNNRLVIDWTRCTLIAISQTGKADRVSVMTAEADHQELEVEDA